MGLLGGLNAPQMTPVTPTPDFDPANYNPNLPTSPTNYPAGYYDSLIPQTDFWDDLEGAALDPFSSIETGGALAPSELLHDPLEYAENLADPSYATGSSVIPVSSDTFSTIGDTIEDTLDPGNIYQTEGDFALGDVISDPSQAGRDLLSFTTDPSDIVQGGGINDFQSDVEGLIDDTTSNYQSLLDDTRGNIDSLLDDTSGNIGDFIEGGTDAFGLGGGAFGTGEGGAGAYTPFGEKALDYLMDYEQLPREYRDQALPSLYGMAQEDFAPTYEQLTADPLYQSQLRAGEEAALRHGAVTGGKRGTDINRSLAANSQQLLENSYNRQLQDRMRKQQAMQGFAFGQPSNTNQISNLMLGIDENAANQQVAQAQMEQARMGQLLGAGSSLAGGLLNFFSDPKLKKNVECLGEYKGLNWCRWIWNEAANKMGLAGVGYGVMADEVEAKYPELAGETNGYRTVNYGGLIDAS
jgi:hypothetical protein